MSSRAYHYQQETDDAIRGCRSRRKHSGSYRTMFAALLFMTATAFVAAFLSPARAQSVLPFTETFDNTNLRDAGETTADWGGSVPGELRLHSTTALSNPFSAAMIPADLANPGTTRSLALADMDGDGDPDLVEGTDGTNGVYLNDGTGVFATRFPITLDTDNTRGVATGDIDGDGDIDVVAGNFNSAPIRVYLNDGTGIAYTAYDVTSAERPVDNIALVDTDGDGFLDVVAAVEGSNQNTIYRNTGSPLLPFGEHGVDGVVVSAVAEDSQLFLSGDLDNDDDIDLIVLNEAQINRQHLNNGDGTFSTDPVNTEIANSQGGALGDLNGDGFLDLVVADFDPGQTSKIYLNSGTADPFDAVTPTDLPDTGAGALDYEHAVALADADNDGDLDIFLSTAGLGNQPQQPNRLYINDGGTFATYVQIGAETDITNFAVVGDVNGDSQVDYITGNESRDLANNAGPAANRLYLNAGTDAGGAGVLQLTAVATSIDVASDVTDIPSVRLTTTPASAAVGLHNAIEFWVSGDGGTTWASISPTARPILLPVAGQDLRWRGHLSSLSPSTLAPLTTGAPALALDDLTLTRNDAGPAINNAIGDQPATEDAPFNASADMTDADGDTVLYSLTGLPEGSGLTFDALTGTIGGAPNDADVDASASGSGIELTVTGTDGAFSVDDTFTLTVTNINDAPAFTSTPVTAATQDVAYAYNIETLDVDPGDSVAITSSALPAWLTLNDNGYGTATLGGTPGPEDVSNVQVTLTVTDLDLATAEQNFTISVANVNDAPEFSSTPVTAATQDVAYTYEVTTTDADGDAVTITAPTLPGWLNFVDNGDGTASLSGTPTVAEIGDHSVSLEVTDTAPASATQDFTITVAGTNDAPTFTSTPVTAVTEAMAYVYMITATDADGDPLAITAPTLPGWLSLTDNGDGTAELSGTPTGAETGDHTVELLVEDPLSASQTQAFTVTVTPATDGPVIALVGAAQINVTLGGTFNDPGATASDPQDGDLTAQIQVDNPVNPGAAGTYTVTYSVTDSAGNMAEVQRTVVVRRNTVSNSGGGGGSFGILGLAALGLLSVTRRRRLLSRGPTA